MKNPSPIALPGYRCKGNGHRSRPVTVAGLRTLVADIGLPLQAVADLLYAPVADVEAACAAHGIAADPSKTPDGWRIVKRVREVAGTGGHGRISVVLKAHGCHVVRGGKRLPVVIARDWLQARLAAGGTPISIARELGVSHHVVYGRARRFGLISPAKAPPATDTAARDEARARAERVADLEAELARHGLAVRALGMDSPGVCFEGDVPNRVLDLEESMAMVEAA